MNENEVFNILSAHVPPNAVTYAFQLWKETPFQLKLSRRRETKVGDFTFRKNSRIQRITLNHDLNPYLFLITYVHEIAHLRVYLHFEDTPEPHGREWKNVFRNLMSPILQENIFPAKILHVLSKHMHNPKASSFADRELTLALREWDFGYAKQTTVSELPEGSIFKLQGRYFKKGKLKRTRILCNEIKSKRQYLVPAEAIVTDIQLSLL